MNDFLSWCMHLLVPFLFAVTSLHPPSFHRNDFSSCSTSFWDKAPSKMCWLTENVKTLDLIWCQLVQHSEQWQSENEEEDARSFVVFCLRQPQQLELMGH